MPHTISGFGTKYYGEADHRPDGSFIATEWITAAYIPLIPLRSLRLMRSGNPLENDFGHATFGVLEKVPLFWSQILRVYAFLLGAGIWDAIMTWLFFCKFNLPGLFLPHRIEATLLLFMFVATLAIPFIIVWSIRRRSMITAGVTPRDFGDSPNGKKLRPAQKAFAVIGAAIFVLPPIIVCELNLPPASWLNARLSKLSAGSYSPELTFVLLAVAYVAVLLFFLLLLSAIVKELTGKKLLQWFGYAGAKDSLQAAPPLPTAAPPLPTAPPPTGREEVLITHCPMCNFSIPPEQGTAKTCPSCGADLSRRRH